MTQPVRESAVQTLEKITQLICASCGFEANQVLPDISLVQELGVDSIDLMDLLYGIEREFKVQISLADFERRARALNPSAVFAVDGVITADGITSIGRLLPEVSAALYPSGLLIQQIPMLFTARAVARLVDERVAEKFSCVEEQNISSSPTV